MYSTQEDHGYMLFEYRAGGDRQLYEDLQVAYRVCATRHNHLIVCDGCGSYVFVDDPRVRSCGDSCQRRKDAERKLRARRAQQFDELKNVLRSDTYGEWRQLITAAYGAELPDLVSVEPSSQVLASLLRAYSKAKREDKISR